MRQVVAHLPKLLRFGRVLTGRAQDAEDLAQETLVRAHQKRGDLDDPARLASWLYSIQRNLFLNSRRGLRPKLEVLEGGLSSRSEERVGNLEDEIHSRHLDDELQGALASLQPEWREALWLREVEELSYEEIAEVQGCPVGTVRSRLARARGAMLDSMTQKERRHGRV